MAPDAVKRPVPCRLPSVTGGSVSFVPVMRTVTLPPARPRADVELTRMSAFEAKLLTQTDRRAGATEGASAPRAGGAMRIGSPTRCPGGRGGDAGRDPAPLPRVQIDPRGRAVVRVRDEQRAGRHTQPARPRAYT